MVRLPPDYLDEDTPPSVVVNDRRAPSTPDPTLGIEVAAVGSAGAGARHRLVTIGDSLTHGLTSGAVSASTAMSWPAQVAKALGIKPFTCPTYGGPLKGIPINMEAVARALQKKYGTDLEAIEKLQLLVTLTKLLEKNEDYWERGAGSATPKADVRWTNLAIYGWDLRDALSYTTARAERKATRTKADFLSGFKPEADNDIAAWSVLAPFGAEATQLDAAEALAGDGGIGMLVVALGANNALGTVVEKKVVWSGEHYADVAAKSPYNVWDPDHFRREYDELVARLRTIDAERVVLSTVPHVTIAPIAKGVNPDAPGQKWRPDSRYFPYYTDPWIDERRFDPRRHRHLTHQQARAIDSAIDQYNEVIVAAVRAARTDGRDWLVFDLCGLLDSFAYRRYLIDRPAADANDVQPIALPAPLKGLDTRFFLADRRGRRQGGLIGLDGIHPTVSGYALVARHFLEMLGNAGNDASARAGARRIQPIDFDAVWQRDTLNNDPPALISSVLNTYGPLLGRLI